MQNQTEPSPVASSRRGWKSLLSLGIAALACPCHLPLVLILFAGTTLGAWMSQHRAVVTLVMLGVFVISLLALFIQTLLDPTDWFRETAPTAPGLWIGAAMCFYFLRGVVNKGFGRSWGRWPQLMVGFLALVAIVYSLIFSGNWWGQPLGALMFVLILYVTGHLGLSFVLAGILGQPG